MSPKEVRQRVAELRKLRNEASERMLSAREEHTRLGWEIRDVIARCPRRSGSKPWRWRLRFSSLA